MSCLLPLRERESSALFSDFTREPFFKGMGLLCLSFFLKCIFPMKLLLIPFLKIVTAMKPRIAIMKTHEVGCLTKLKTPDDAFFMSIAFPVSNTLSVNWLSPPTTTLTSYSPSGAVSVNFCSSSTSYKTSTSKVSSPVFTSTDSL